MVLTVLLVVPASATVLSVAQDLRGAAPSTPVDTPGPPGYCVEHSGGDTRCPGG